MALLTQNDVLTQVAATTLTRYALSASDTFAYVEGTGQKLVLWNTTGSPVVVTLTNATPNSTTAVSPSRFGGAITTSAGKTASVPATGTLFIDCDDYAAYLSGAGLATITGGTGVTAHLFV